MTKFLGVWRGRLSVGLCVWAIVLPALAQEVTQRPMPRPALPNVAVPVAPIPKPQPRPTLANPAPAVSVLAAPRPQPRPAVVAAPQTPAAQTSAAVLRSPRPLPRPDALLQAAAALSAAPSADAPAQTAAPRANPNLLQLLFGAGKAPRTADEGALASAAPAPTAPSRSQSQPRKGSVCGDTSIRGEVIAPITSRTKGCGVAEPVRVTEVAGVRLSQAVTVECGTVVALQDWIDSAMRPAFGKRDVVELRIAAHYVCRGRNNQRGARISEHGKGKAVDIAGFVFDDGTEWSISRDYNKQIRAAHKGACGIFGTTLGPGSDGFHEDHLHFDTAAYRSGPYCR
jgi:hypothetical protein